MSYITHNKYEFNRTVCMKRKEKHTGLYIQSSPSFHIHFIGKDGDLFYRQYRNIFFLRIY